jgi:hypothetical protein
MEANFTSRLEYRTDGGQTLIHEVSDFKSALNNLALIAGDAIHNARTALDFAWCSTIERCLPDKISKRTKFPVRETLDEVKAALRGIEVDTRCPTLFSCLVNDIQPFNGGNTGAIWTLHTMDIADKHLLLLDLEPVGRISEIGVRHASGALHHGSSMPAVGGEGRYAIDFEHGIRVEQRGKLSVGVVIQDAGDYSGVLIDSVLSGLTNFALYTVGRLENIR